jgi:hypothetical protein
MVSDFDASPEVAPLVDGDADGLDVLEGALSCFFCSSGLFVVLGVVEPASAGPAISAPATVMAAIVVHVFI